MAIPNPGKLILANIQKSIYTWVKNQAFGQVPPEQILWRQGSEALPPRPCITLKVIDGPKRVGYSDSFTAIGDTGTYNLGGQRVMTISVQIFGNTQVSKPMAIQLAIDLNASLSKQTVLDQLRGAGIAVFNQGAVANITDLEETEYEERAQFDVELGVAENVVDDPGVIEQVALTTNVSGP